MKVYEALAKAFAAEGTTAVYGLMGNANQFWIDALARLGVNVYEVRHEGAGLAMADGWARLNGLASMAGTPGVCTATGGPGTTQLATTMVCASRARTPLVAFCGDTPWGTLDSVQGLDQERFAAAVECGFVRVNTPDLAYEAVQKAFYLARVGSRPVMLSAAMDVQQMTIDDDDEYQPSSALLNVARMSPSPDLIAAAVDRLATAEHPVIIVGRGAVRAGAGDEVIEVAKRVGAIIATTLLAANWLAGRDDFHAGISGLYSTRTAMELFQECDCVLAVGASMNHFTTEHGYLFPEAEYIQIDTQNQVVMGDGRSADVYIQADARLGAKALAAGLERGGVSRTGFRCAEVRERLKRRLDDPADYSIEPGTVDPRSACRVIDDMLPSEMGLGTGAGHQAQFAEMLCTRERAFSLATKSFGSIGNAMTTVIGAVMASGNQPAAVIDGDASIMMQLPEFETAVRYGVPVLVVVLNDQGLSAEVHKAQVKGLDPSLTNIPTPDIGRVAQALGGRGALIRTIDELAVAVARFVADPAPTLLDVRVSPNVVSVQYRRLWYGDDLA